MSAGAYNEKGQALKKEIAKQLREGKVFSGQDIANMAEARELHRTWANALLNSLTNETFTRETGVKAKKVRFGYRATLIFGAEVDLRNTNAREKLNEMLKDRESKSPKRGMGLKATIGAFAKEHNLPE